MSLKRMSNTVNLNSNNDCINKTAKKSSKSTGIYQFIFYYKVFIYFEFDCEFQKRKSEKRKQNQTISQLSFIQERIEHICLYLTNLFFLFLQTLSTFRYFSRIEWKKLQTNFYLVVCFILSKQQFWSLIFGPNINSK